MSLIRKSFTFSNVIAVIALFLALGGSVYAASNKISGSQIKPKSLPGNRIKAGSLTGAQLKTGTITATQVQAGSLTGAQVKAGSLTGTQVVGSTLTGVTASSVGAVQYVSHAVVLSALAPNGTVGSAGCPSGQKVIGGGATVSDEAEAWVNDSAPSNNRNEWVATGFGPNGSTMTVTAICTAVASATG